MEGSIEEIKSLGIREGAEMEKQDRTVMVTTGPAAWGYAAEIPLSLRGRLDRKYWYWIRIQAQVLKRQAGIGLLSGDDLLNEKMIGTGSKRDVFVILDRQRKVGDHPQ